MTLRSFEGGTVAAAVAGRVRRLPGRRRADQRRPAQPGDRDDAGARWLGRLWQGLTLRQAPEGPEDGTKVA
ncbi:hypothetical protein GCM10018962_47070 [Dactylosporangium matsuzakiense]|uniref:Uncharacterized protein n=1 Tax=Dactylosporangium matsuzakiense TaxID=53360 RepID=A0A9W6KS19_9ACTN|nr:hypothetical protein GCM10017581_061960 [Dactylosporangium matsuzakiense]